MHAKPSILEQLFTPLPRATPLAQWHVVDATYARLSPPRPAEYGPIAGGLAAYGLSGQPWCLAWVVAAAATVLAMQRVAAAFQRRGTNDPPSLWARRYRTAVLAQAALLGAGGFAAAQSGDAASAMPLLLSLAFAASRAGAGAKLAATASWQVALLLGPAALGGLLTGLPSSLALGVSAALLACMGAAQAQENGAAMLQEAESQAALAHEPLAGHTALPKAAADFQKLLGRDQATGLPNRHSFMHLLAQESARAFRAETALSLLLVAWDDYDAAAARLGAAGLDARIASIARRLRGTLHRQQDILASLGGGRFAVVLPFTDAFGAKTVAENLQAALRLPVLENDSAEAPCPVPISIGAATYCGKGLLPETQLLHFAEEALASARKTGGDRISRYDPMIDTLRPAPYAGAVPAPAPQGMATAK
jgi:diguanylate cyclase (GGDEF)-like protein